MGRGGGGVVFERVAPPQSDRKRRRVRCCSAVHCGRVQHGMRVVTRAHVQPCPRSLTSESAAWPCTTMLRESKPTSPW